MFSLAGSCPKGWPQTGQAVRQTIHCEQKLPFSMVTMKKITMVKKNWLILLLLKHRLIAQCTQPFTRHNMVRILPNFKLKPKSSDKIEALVGPGWSHSHICKLGSLFKYVCCSTCMCDSISLLFECLRACVYITCPSKHACDVVIISSHQTVCILVFFFLSIARHAGLFALRSSLLAHHWTHFALLHQMR